MDCSYLAKSGHKTYGLGFFYDSSHDQPAKGLEISNLAVIDVTDNTGYTLSSWQTPPQEQIEQLVAAGSTAGKQDDEQISRVDFYAEHLRWDAVHLPAEVTYLAVDGYYPKLKFVKVVRALDLHLVSKLRHDANLRYLYQGPQKKFGAKRKYAGKVKFDDLSRFEYVGEVEQDIHLYTLIFAWSISSICVTRTNPVMPCYSRPIPNWRPKPFSAMTKLASKSSLSFAMPNSSPDWATVKPAGKTALIFILMPA